MPEYDDDYRTCHETYATVCINLGNLDPDEVTRRLGIEPSEIQHKGDAINPGGRRPRLAPFSGWFLTSQHHIHSKDSRRHIDWLLDRLEPSAAALRVLHEQGCRIDIACYWETKDGHGGPELPASQMKRLADLKIDLWLDFYC